MHETRVQGNSISEIADEFGTPLFVYDTDILRETYQDLRDRLPKQLDIFFSLKANPNISVCAFLGALGAGAEVSSQAELVTALRAGVRPENVIFLGPGKDSDDLNACLDAGIHAVVCESLDELRLLDELVTRRGGSDCRAVMRVNPSFSTKGSGLAMGGKPRQFGVDEDVVAESKRFVADLRHIRVIGIHAYMGTRFLYHDDVVHNTGRILDTAERLADQLGIPLEIVDVGGGLGVAYFDNEDELDLDALGARLREVILPFAERHPRCRLVTELGRYLTAAAGTYVVRARYVKESMGESFVVADGGTNHHMAAVGIGSFVKRNFPIHHLTRPDEPPLQRYSVTGPLCTPNDIVAKKVALPRVEPGDLIGVQRSGAYGPTASPGLFLSQGFPAEVLVHRGRALLVRERDTTQDLLAKQHLVDFVGAS
ncbi:diaminopimelate decarboxylase [Saccharopolyspora lacisalsi]|uniref:Diaminopimelate decarboxylase n=1 Tax=Halosaccharopolyspora lacisalsi TaxID=1000566 RepID=A0A839DSC7_9PSEU|nr:diaminopimelate decarboxylase [Halosaccharopolyspora lacisalsi]MBA8823983.1 diaminopimelate decarboxylase [Halosaccharopolyspora lacisalsi]